MNRLSDKDRLHLQRVLEKLEELEIYAIQREKLRTNNTLWYATERLFIKAGELMKRFRDGCDSIFRSTSIFKSLTGYRDILAHKVDTDVEIVIKSFDHLKELKKEIQTVLVNNNSENVNLAKFKLFGKSDNKLNRQRLIDTISDNLTNPYSPDKLKFSKGNKFEIFNSEINEIIQNEDLLGLTSSNNTIRDEVNVEIINWIDETTQQIKNEDLFQKEFERINQIRLLTPNQFLRKYYSFHNEMIQELPELQNDLEFYNNKRLEINRKIRKNKKEEKTTLLSEVEAIQSSILDIIEKRILEKKLKAELELINKQRINFQETLYERVKKYNKLKELVSLFSGDTGKLWGLSTSLWESTDFSIIKRYSELLKKEKSIRLLAEMLGRFKNQNSGKIQEEISKKIINQNWELVHAPKGEYVGITQGDDISSTLMSELAMVSNEDTETVFYMKMLEKQLLTFDQKDFIKKSYETDITEIITKDVIKNNGPIILCVDTSGSMLGLPERIAKTIAFAVLKIALLKNRKCFLISFSKQIETINLTNMSTDLDALIKFLSYSFHGGTDADNALVAALEMTKTEEFEYADILMISDFIIPDLAESTIDKIVQVKSLGTQLHSLTISDNHNANSITHFDNNWIYNTSDEERSIIEITNQIKLI